MQTISRLTGRLLASERGLCLLLLLTATELSLGGSSPYTSTDKTILYIHFIFEFPCITSL